MPKDCMKVNETGRRIGEDHPRAVLLDHDVDLLLDLLIERDALIDRLTAGGARRIEIDVALNLAGLSYTRLAAKFEVHRTTIYKIAKGKRRCQTPV